MSRYVDGFVIPIKKKNLKKYAKMAKLGCKVWMDHGALDYYECVGDEISQKRKENSFTSKTLPLPAFLS